MREGFRRWLIFVKALPFAALIASTTVLGMVSGHYIGSTPELSFILAFSLSFIGFALGVFGVIKLIDIVYY